MNKLEVQQALSRLQEAAENLEAYGHEYGRTRPTADAKLIRRFLNAERQEILILRRWVLLGASRLEEAFLGSDTSDGLIAEMRARAKPRRKPR